MKSTADLALLDRHLSYLCLSFVRQHCQSLATEAARKELSHLDYLAQLAEGEASLRQDRAVARRIKAARFPLIKTLDSFRWDWPKKINRLQIQDLFRLQFTPGQSQRHFPRPGRRRKIPSRHGPWLRRMPARTIRSLRQRYRRDQHPLRRTEQRCSQSRAA